MWVGDSAAAGGGRVRVGAAAARAASAIWAATTADAHASAPATAAVRHLPFLSGRVKVVRELRPKDRHLLKETVGPAHDLRLCCDSARLAPNVRFNRGWLTRLAPN